jgi:hypothetical protein
VTSTGSAGGGLCAASCQPSGGKCALTGSSACCYPYTCEGLIMPLSGTLSGNVTPILGTCQ